ncbi:MAG: tRNA (adenosine(37)-N6)-dimethylallyltransferase MiaA [Candidatus Nomurabacteria bacterium]|nr:tRNA (adenosine(37)-N6)-dimethylallyltransferase MiaA [Candidatus Nomurabacteria bacterium]
MSEKHKIYVICGPTATGKTARAIALAKKIDGEIISADSRQVYRGMDIGTAKITTDEMSGIPHHMIDIVDPNDEFSVHDFQRLGRIAIDDILSRGKIPIIAGGTGYYIDALVFDKQMPEVAPNPKLRAELNKLTTDELFARIVPLDPDRAQTIDKHNHVRLVRALEIIDTLGYVPENTTGDSLFDIQWEILDLPDDKLRYRIHERNVARIENGLIEEVQELNNNGVSWERLEKFGLEYRYVSQFINGKIESKEKLIEILDAKTWQFAKRQRLWFRKYADK